MRDNAGLRRWDAGPWTLLAGWRYSLESNMLTLAGTGGGGMMQPPCGFSGIFFFVNRSIVTIFSIAFRPSFLRPT